MLNYYEQSYFCDQNIKGNNEPLHDKKHLLFKFSVIFEVWYHGVGIMK
jgi:hypothetical protein